MSYTPTVWKTGDVISSAKLNKLENGVAAKPDTLTFDNSPTANSTNPVTSGGIKTALDAKQDNLTVDQTPTASSANPVTSGGVYTALETKANIEDVTKEISKETARSYMTESASGNIVKFSDGADDIPMEEVRVNFSPIQEGSGDPSPDNIRPITGRTGVNVEQRNRNLFEYAVDSPIVKDAVTLTKNDDGSITVSGTPVTSATIPIWNTSLANGGSNSGSSQGNDGVKCLPNGSYVITGGSEKVGVQVCRMFADGTLDAVVTAFATSNTVTVTDDHIAVWFRIILQTGATYPITITPMIRLASDTDSTYENPTSKHYPVTWEDKGTVYGGYVNNNGKLVATWGGKTFSDLRVQKDSSATYAFAQVTDKAGGANNIICESLKTSSAGSASLMSNGDIRGRATDGYIFFRDDSCETATDYATKYADTRIAYELATPIEYDIDSVEIKSLLGDNVMWSDGDTIEVSYHADTETLMDSKIEEAKSQTVSVSGTAPTITAAENTRYICGEVVSLSFTPSSSGVSEVIFTAGSTVPVITLPSTVKMPEWYEIEANHVYEISVLNGVYGAVMSWAV